MRRCSLMPPTLVTSGCTMSKAPRTSQGMKLCRRVSTSPPAIGTGLARRRVAEIVDGVGLEGLLEPADVVSPSASPRCAAPISGRAANRHRWRPASTKSLRCRPSGLARRAHDGLVELASSSARPKGPQPILKARKPRSPICRPPPRASPPVPPSAASNRAARAGDRCRRAAGPPAGPVALPRMSQSAISMPLMAWVSVPPRPIQKRVLMQLLRDALGLQRVLARHRAAPAP